ncbi:TetR family transcriptional regulator (plasmid) [Deinococcus radiomollis]|uniref:TetR/AcrR family transcriptional regulator n=1 Tax=Deinococcus radiomollis TaxID=468916 RepID=UPI00389236D7
MTENQHQNLPLRRGRRPGAGNSRQTILDAARARFAEDGYATTIRKIAADAGVNPALVMQFFRSKEDLFAAVMSISPGALSRIDQAFDGPEHGLGERVTRAHLTLWESDPQDSEALLAMLRAAVSTPQAAEQLREFIQARLLKQLGLRLHTDHDATVRAGLAASMLMGVIVGRRIVQVPALAAEDLESVIRMVAPGIQMVLTSRPGA